MKTVKRILSAFLAMALICGMMPTPVAASESGSSEIAGAEAEQTVAAVIPVEETTVPAETAEIAVPEETEKPETEPAETAAEETVPENTVQESESEDKANAEAALALTPDENGSYYITTFEELEELAAGSYEWGTFAYYEGNGPLVIERSLTMPGNLILMFYDENSSLVIPTGVTLTTAQHNFSLTLDSLTVAGTMVINNYVSVWENLNVSGQIQLNNGSIHVHASPANVTVTGSVGGNNRPRWKYSEVITTELLEAAINAANADTSGWLHEVEISGYTDVTIDKSLTIPENMEVNMWGSCTFTIAEGCTLTVNACFTSFQSPILVKGELVNNCANFNITKPMTIADTGSYSGTGYLYVPTTMGYTSWDQCVIGLDTANIQISTVNEGRFWQISDMSGRSKLATPADPTWHKMAVGNQIYEATGHVYWKSMEPTSEMFWVRIYNADTDEQVYATNCSFGGMQTNDRSLSAFLEADLPSGNYYFTVTSASQGGDFADSDPAKSDVWSYTRTASPMAKSSILKWSWPDATWTAPAGANNQTTYRVEWYYAPTAEAEPQMRGSDINVFGTKKNIQPWITESCGKGYYSFKVRAVPNDITKYRIGEWSDMSEAFYYDPATFHYNENHLLEGIQTGFIPDMDFKFLSAPVVLENDFALPENLQLDIGPGGSITVPAGKTLTLNNPTSIYNGGKLIVEEGGTLIVNRNIWLGFDGTIEIRGDIRFAQDIWVNISYGQSFTMNGVPTEKVMAEALFDAGCTMVENLLSFFENSKWGWIVLRVEGDMILPRSLTSPANSNIYIPENSSLTIPAGCTLTIPKYAEINIEGQLSNRGIVNASGGFIVRTGAEVDNNGTIRMMEGTTENWGGYMYVMEGSTVRNNGVTVVNSCSEARIEGNWEGSAIENLGGQLYLPNAFDNFKEQINEAAEQGMTVTLSNTVTLKEDLTIPANVILRLENGGTLVVPEGKTLTISGRDNFLSDGSAIVVEEGGTLNLNQTLSCLGNSKVEVRGSINGSGAIIANYENGEFVTEVCGVPYDMLWLRFMVNNDADLQNAVQVMAQTDYVDYILLVHGDIDLSADLIIPENARLLLTDSPSTMTIPAGKTVINNGEITVNEDQTIHNYGMIESNGSCYINGRMVNDGTFKNEGNLYINGVWEGTSPENRSMNQEDLEDAMEAAGQFYVLYTEVTLVRDLQINCSLKIDNGGRLIVPKGVKLTIAADCSVIVEPGGMLEVYGNYELKKNADGWSSAISKYTYTGELGTVIGIKDEDIQVDGHVSNTADFPGVLHAVQNHPNGTWNFIYLYTSIELSSDTMIPENCIFHLYNGAVLTVPSGITLENHGEFYCWQGQSVKNYGVIENNGFFGVFGSFYNYSQMHLRADGYLMVDQPGYVNNSGSVNSYIMGSEDILGTWEGNPIVRHYTTHSELKNMVDEAAKLGMTVTLNNTVILEENLTIPANVLLRLENGGTLVVPEGKTLTLNGSASLYNCGQLTVEAGGALILNSDVWTNYNDRVYVAGTCTFGKTAQGELAKVHYSYDSGCEIIGISEENQVLHMVADNTEFPGWQDYVELFENNDYAACELVLFPFRAVLNQDIKVPANGTLVINPSWDDINNGTRNDWVVINGNMEVYGTMWINAYYNGTPCNLEINGNVSVRDGGVLMVAGNVCNNGNVYLFAGSEINYYDDFGRVWEGNAPEYLSITHAQFEKILEDAKKTGTAYLRSQVMLEKNVTIPEIVELRIEGNGELVIPKGKTLTVNGQLSVWSDGKLDVEAGGKLVNNGGIYNHDFYSDAYIHVAGSYSGKGIFQVDGTMDKIADVSGVQTKYLNLNINNADEETLYYVINAGLDYGMVTVHTSNTATLNLTKDVTIPANVVLLINSEAEIEEGVNVTVSGSLVVYHFEGIDFLIHGSLTNNGTLILNKNSYLTVYGDYAGNAPINNGGSIEPRAASVTIEAAENVIIDEKGNATVEEGDSAPVFRAKVENGIAGLQCVTWTSSNKKVVDAEQIIDNGDGTYTIPVIGDGTAKLTATAIDGSKKSATVNLTVTPAQTKTLTLSPSELILDKADLTDAASRTFTIEAEALDKYGNAISLDKKSIKWTSSDTKLASVKVNNDGSATVTIAANKDGMATITAQTTDLAKITATMTLTVYDKAPKLGTAAVILNPMMISGVDVALVPGYENKIREVTIDSADLKVSYNAETDMLNIMANKALKNGNINSKLNVTCENGRTYELALKVTIKSTTPSVTIKQMAKMDLFYTDSETTLTVTAKDAVVAGLDLTGTDDFYMDEEGVIHFADDLDDKYAANAKYKPNTKATLLVHLEGYAFPVEKAITISTSATKLTLTTDPASSAVNTNEKFGGAALDVFFTLYSKTEKQTLDLEDTDIVAIDGYDESEVMVLTDSDEVSLTLKEAKKATLAISVQKEGWMYPVTLKHSVSVTDKDPTVKLGKSTVKLNSNLLQLTDSTSAILTSGNLDLTFGDFEPVKADANAELIWVEYVNAGSGGDIVAFIEPSANGEVPKAGTYSFKATPYANGVALKDVTVKVSVSAAEPKLTLGAKGKLDAVDPASEIVYTVNKIANVEGSLTNILISKIEVNGVEQDTTLFELSELAVDDKGTQYITLKLAEGFEYSTKATYTVTFSYEIYGEYFDASPVNVKVTQSSLKIKTTPEQYVPGQGTIQVNLALTAPAGAKLDQVVINEAKTAKELLAALDESMLGENLLEEAAAEADLTIILTDDTSLEAGKSYKLVLDITPVGHASDAKVTTVTVNIKIAK